MTILIVILTQTDVLVKKTGVFSQFYGYLLVCVENVGAENAREI